jgi:hypothetical protein
MHGEAASQRAAALPSATCDMECASTSCCVRQCLQHCRPVSPTSDHVMCAFARCVAGVFACMQLPVQVLAFAPSAGFALSAAEAERLVAVWATPSKQGSRKKAGSVAAASLAVEQPVVGLSTVGELLVRVWCGRGLWRDCCSGGAVSGSILCMAVSVSACVSQTPVQSALLCVCTLTKQLSKSPCGTATPCTCYVF